MRFTCISVVVAALLAASVAVAGPFGPERLYRVNPLPEGVTPEPSSLADIPGMTGFIDGRSGEPAQVQTAAWGLVDEQALHVIVRCDEPAMDQLVAKVERRQDADASVFSDDCVEVFVSPAGSEDDYYHFAVNANNARWDERVKDRAWTAGWSSTVERQEDGWVARLVIPHEDIGGPPDDEAMWWFNVSRQRQAGGETQLSSWSDADADFHDLSHWGRLIFSDDYAAILRRAVLQPWSQRVDDLADRARIYQPVAEHVEEALVPLREDMAPVRQAVEGGGPDDVAGLSRLLATGEAALAGLAQVEEDLGAAIRAREAARAMRELARPGQRLLAWPVRAITNRRIMPAPEPPKRIERTIRMRACPGEIEPASFVVYPLGEEMTVLPVVTDLDGPGLGLRSRHIDIHAIKRWYQASEGGTRFPFNEGVRVLTPELLLHDDSLVRVDHENRENYMKLRFEDREEYLWISSPEPTEEEQRISNSEQPIYDTDELLPVTIPADTAKQFWITVRVPEYLPAGTYRGAVELRSGGGVIETVGLELEVLPFELEPNPLESSIYFHWGIELTTGEGTVRHRKRSFSQYRAELHNLLDHGVDNPTLGVRPQSGMLPVALALREAVGMANDHLYYLIARTSTPPERLREIIDIAESFGFEDVYFYGRDEAKGDALVAQREEWQRVHEAGGKVFVAGQSHESFPLVGDLQDLLVNYGDPSAEAAGKWHSQGHKIFCYANPQSGLEEPETYRRNFGLLLWANDYDGGMTYIFYHGWNDFSGSRYRQHNFIYPTVDGGIDTIQWEGYREGIDDLRYLGTLQRAIAEAREAGGPRARLADRAQQFLDTMDVSGDLYAIRDAMIRWTLRLRGE
ncbi:MAG: sugar-binding protein [Armatimonadota bacterium]|nr:sugar-binding protein [Armatimonadota bacterium]